jgi:bifunctional non-homologous end joining protein LigD
LTRYPDGIEGKYFYQQDAPDWVPGWIRRVRLYSKEGEREIEHFVCDSVQALVYLANLGCIPLHVWNARLGALDRPDWLILDLDPGDASFADVVAVAHGLRRLLQTIGLRVFPKTSGATGLHLLLPLGARYPHGDVKRFAELVARVAAERLPDIATVERRPSRRDGKVYIDFGQNGYGKTIAAPYAVRARPGAPVSAPLRWTQVRAGLDPARFTIKTLPERIRRVTEDPLRAVLGPGCDLGTALARLERDYV